MIVIRRGTHPPSFGAVRTVALEILKSGPRVAPLLACCLLLAACLLPAPCCLLLDPPKKKLYISNLLKQLGEPYPYRFTPAPAGARVLALASVRTKIATLSLALHSSHKSSTSAVGCRICAQQRRFRW